MNGRGPLPADDDPVEPSVLLYRLVPITHCDPVDGEWVFQSAAFDNATALTPDEHDEDMSVVIGDTLAATEREPSALPRNMPNAEQWGVAELLAEHVYEESQAVLRTPNGRERAHGDVRGPKGKTRRRRLKKRARWVMPPAAPPPT